MNRYINNDEEHNRVLYELGLLDDDDDYQLFCQMQAEQEENEPDLELWWKYVVRLKEPR